MSDENTLDLGDIDARPRQLDDAQASEITGGFTSKKDAMESKVSGSKTPTVSSKPKASKSKPSGLRSRSAPAVKKTS